MSILIFLLPFFVNMKFLLFVDSTHPLCNHFVILDTLNLYSRLYITSVIIAFDSSSLVFMKKILGILHKYLFFTASPKVPMVPKGNLSFVKLIIPLLCVMLLFNELVTINMSGL